MTIRTDLSPHSPSLPRALILTVSFVQGLLMLALDWARAAGRWPAGDPQAVYTLVSMLVAIPTFFLLLIDENNIQRALGALVMFALVIFGVAAYVGYQTGPVADINSYDWAPVFVLSIIIFSFKALLYAQQYSFDNPISYPALLHYSWRNFLLMGLALLFTLLFIGILRLWGALFDLIGISFFSSIFTQAWFLFPAGTTAFGFAIIIFRSLSSVIDSIARLLLTLFKFLLPVLALIAVLFVVFLPFTGLQSVWDKDIGSGLFLAIQALLLFGINSVYQSDAKTQPYPLLLHRLVYLSIAVLPIYSILALQGIFIRIAQYGLTMARCWAVLLATILLSFALGYLWSIVKKRDQWLQGLAWVNIRMGLLLMILLLLVNTPVLNMQALTANSQLNRVTSGGITLDKLDLNYFRYSLGRQGYQALQTIKTTYGASNPTLLTAIDQLYAVPVQAKKLTSVNDLRARIISWPAGRTVPAKILQQIYDGASALPDFIGYYAIFIDMNTDGQEEIITVFENPSTYTRGLLWTSVNGEWRQQFYQFENILVPPALATAIDKNQISVVQPVLNNVRIGAMEIYPLPVATEKFLPLSDPTTRP